MTLDKRKEIINQNEDVHLTLYGIGTTQDADGNSVQWHVYKAYSETGEELPNIYACMREVCSITGISHRYSLLEYLDNKYTVYPNLFFAMGKENKRNVLYYSIPLLLHKVHNEWHTKDDKKSHELFKEFEKYNNREIENVKRIEEADEVPPVSTTAKMITESIHEQIAENDDLHKSLAVFINIQKENQELKNKIAELEENGSTLEYDEYIKNYAVIESLSRLNSYEQLDNAYSLVIYKSLKTTLTAYFNTLEVPSNVHNKYSYNATVLKNWLLGKLTFSYTENEESIWNDYYMWPTYTNDVTVGKNGNDTTLRALFMSGFGFFVIRSLLFKENSFGSQVFDKERGTKNIDIFFKQLSNHLSCSVQAASWVIYMYIYHGIKRYSTLISNITDTEKGVVTLASSKDIALVICTTSNWKTLLREYD